MHQGVTYKCNQCTFITKWQPTLNHHKLSKHEGVRYKCKLSVHDNASSEGLKEHILIKHEGVRYVCKQCNVKSTK